MTELSHHGAIVSASDSYCHNPAVVGSNSIPDNAEEISLPQIF